MTERRYDPTSGEWVTFATHRQERTYHPEPGDCPLCPTLPGGTETEIPASEFEVVVFDNRFPALRPDPPSPVVSGSAVTPVAPAYGRCEVVVYTDRHDSSLSRVGVPRIHLLIDVWADRTARLGADPRIRYVLPFENRGEAIGVTLSHPHGQIYAFPDIPPRPERELRAARGHHDRHGTCVWCDVVAQERSAPERIVLEGRHVVAAVPFWARWPYQVELWLTRHVGALPDLTSDERQDLAEVLSGVLGAYDALWGFDLPFVLGVHQTPTDSGDWAEVSHLHIEIDPPHRAADKLKYLAGAETVGGAFISDVAPEEAAKRLRQALTRSLPP